jgi:hypothetical protein
MEEFYAELLIALGPNIEPLGSIIAAQRHRDYWRPQNVRLILLAESHIFTTETDLGHIVQGHPILPADAPQEFVRLVYCLGYGENELLHEPIVTPANRGCAEFWKIFNACTALGADPESDNRVLRTRTHPEDRIRTKIGILRELQERGIWLLDASLAAVYRPGGIRLPLHLIEKAIGISWRRLVKEFVQNASPQGVLVLGQHVWNIVSPLLVELQIPSGPTYPPGAHRTRNQRQADRVHLRRCVEDPLAVLEQVPPV